MLKRSPRDHEDPTQARGASVLSDQSHVVMSLVKSKGNTVALTWAKSNYAPLRPPLVLERQDNGLLVPVNRGDTRLLVMADVVREHGGLMPRSTLVKELARRRDISDRAARDWVGKAEETWLIRRVNEHGDPDDVGEYVALSDREHIAGT
jgi:hypothetical protein